MRPSPRPLHKSKCLMNTGTALQANLPHSMIQSKCIAHTTITTATTASVSGPPVFYITESVGNDRFKTGHDKLDVSMQKYLGDAFASLGMLDDGPLPSRTSSTSFPPVPQPTCADKTYSSAIPRAGTFLQGLPPTFCDDRQAGTHKALKKTYTATNANSAKGKRTSWLNLLQKRTPPPAPLTDRSFPGWSVEFEWEPAKGEGGVCDDKQTCTHAMNTLISGCEG